MFLSFNIKTTGVTSGAGNDNPSGALEFTIGFSGVPFYSVFSFLCSGFFYIIVCSFRPLSFGHYVFILSSIYGF
jgi:hypothetical protein